jgi:hypothetical protein
MFASLRLLRQTSRALNTDGLIDNLIGAVARGLQALDEAAANH